MIFHKRDFDRRNVMLIMFLQEYHSNGNLEIDRINYI